MIIIEVSNHIQVLSLKQNITNLHIVNIIFHWMNNTINTFENIIFLPSLMWVYYDLDKLVIVVTSNRSITSFLPDMDATGKTG